MSIAKKIRKRLIKEFVIPASDGEAFEVMKGQVLRIIEVEGKQVGDVCVWNLHNFKECLDTVMTGWYNRNFYKAKRLYSCAPDSNVMFTIIDDKVGVHYLGGRCTARHYEIWYNSKDHPNRQDILAKSIEPYGLTPYDVHGAYSVFMNVEITKEGEPIVKTPLSEKGDYIDMVAEMDCLVAISACPADKSPCNDYKPKPLKIKIFEVY